MMVTDSKKLMQYGQFLDKQHIITIISFMWSTNGIPVFKSLKDSIWPLYFVINELPMYKCWSSSYIILAG